MTHTIHHGNCLEVLRQMPDNSVDAVVTDPPYGLSNTSPDKVADAIVRWATGDREYIPEGRGFMGASWDAFVPPVAVWDECLRVLKPGGHLVAFAGSRTQDLMGLAIRLAGFDIRENLAWLYGSGFPKSLDVSKAIDKRGGASHLTREIGEALKAARTRRGMSVTQADRLFCGGSTNYTWFEGRPIGQRPPTPETFAKIVDRWPELADYASKVAEADREVIGKSSRHGGGIKGNGSSYEVNPKVPDITAPGTPEAEKWQGWGTALKPAHEPIILARKPLSEKTVAANTLTWGTGGLNIDATRIGAGDNLGRPAPAGAFRLDGFSTVEELEAAAKEGRKTPNGRDARTTLKRYQSKLGQEFPANAQGRFPANVVLDRESAGLLDQQSGNRPGFKSQTDRTSTPSNYFGADKHPGEREGYNDEGGASRFFHVADNLDDLDAPFRYCAKAPKKERPSYTDEDGNTVQHATVKPLSLMRWLVKLITPPGGTVLDPFAGSGTTVEAAILEGFNPVGVEAHAPYIPLIHQRVARAEQGQAALNIA